MLNSCCYSAGTEQQPKLRKEKDPKKRKSNKASVPAPAYSPVLVADRPAPNRPGSADSNKGSATTATALNSATATAMANVCTAEGGALLNATGQCPSDSAGLSGGNGSGSVGCCSAGMASASGLNARTKLPRSTSGIRGVTESRAVQAAALSRALDCLKDTDRLNPGKGKIAQNEIGSVQIAHQLSLKTESLSSKCGKEDATTSSWRSILIDPLEASLKKTFAHLEEVPTVKSKVSRSKKKAICT